MPKTYARNCDQCGKPYRGRGAKYCSRACRIAADHGEPSADIVESAAHSPKFLDWPKLAGDWIVMSDPHIPYHSPDMFGKMFAIARKFKMRQFVNVGDLIDFEAFSRFDHSNEHASPAADIDATKTILKRLVREFDKIVLVMGNHDTRIDRALDFKLFLANLARDWVPEAFRNRVEFSRYPYCEVESSGQKYRLTHPKSYSRISARVPTQLCSKYLTHVLGAHGHHLGMSFDASGRYVAADLGGMFDREKHSYVMFSDTTHPAWNAGFAMIRNGALYLFSDNPALTDWEFWLGGK